MKTTLYRLYLKYRAHQLRQSWQTLDRLNARAHANQDVAALAYCVEHYATLYRQSESLLLSAHQYGLMR
jgi:hypothetical protein